MNSAHQLICDSSCQQGSAGSCINYSKNTWEYDSAGRLHAMTNYNWQLGKWKGNLKMTYSYDNTGTIVSDTTLLWNGSAWYYLFRETYSKDGNTLAERWNGNQEKWLKSSYGNTNIYYQNRVRYQEHSEWDSIHKSFVPDFRYRNIYTIDGHIAQSFYKLYNSSTSKWEPNSRTVFTYNDHNDISEYDVYSIKEKSELWQKTAFVTYTYIYPETDTVRDKISASEEDILLSPNPAHDTLQISRIGKPSTISDITIFGPDGKVMREYKMTGLKMTVSTAGLRPNTYSLDFENKDDNIYVLKILYVE